MEIQFLKDLQNLCKIFKLEAEITAVQKIIDEILKIEKQKKLHYFKNPTAIEDKFNLEKDRTALDLKI